ASPHSPATYVSTLSLHDALPIFGTQLRVRSFHSGGAARFRPHAEDAAERGGTLRHAAQPAAVQQAAACSVRHRSHDRSPRPVAVGWLGTTPRRYSRRALVA